MNLKHKIALITGAASGLGEATARHLVSIGMQVGLIDKDAEKLAKLGDELNSKAIPTDVTVEQEVQTAVETAVAHFSAIHCLVNCAGIAPGALVVGREQLHPLDMFKKVIDINLIGTFNFMRLVAEKMSQQQPVTASGERGVIINTSSIAAFEGQKGQVAYSASKAAIVGMTLPAARDLARFGIRVMTIAPGMFETPLSAGINEKVTQPLQDASLFPKRFGQAHEYAKLVQAIIENEMLNGSVIRLDAGLRLP